MEEQETPFSVLVYYGNTMVPHGIQVFLKYGIVGVLSVVVERFRVYA